MRQKVLSQLTKNRIRSSKNLTDRLLKCKKLQKVIEHRGLRDLENSWTLQGIRLKISILLDDETTKYLLLSEKLQS